MTEDPFVDYYDLLQLSPNADEDPIDRVFRRLAKKCHPDIGEASNEVSVVSGAKSQIRGR